MTTGNLLSSNYKIIFTFDATMCNPNGDPNNDNQPRRLPNGKGHITSGCLKSKIKNYVLNKKTNESGSVEHGFDIFVKKNTYKEDQLKRGYEHLSTCSNDSLKNTKKEKLARDWCTENFWDVRMFGSVLNFKDYKAGNVKGCVQVFESVSVDAIDILPVSITCCSRVSARDNGGNVSEEYGTFGSKYIIPYALYTCVVSVSKEEAKNSGVTEDDLNLFIEGCLHMFEGDGSRQMAVREIHVFKGTLGNVENRISIKRKESKDVAECFADYVVNVELSNLPEGVEYFVVKPKY